MGRIPLDLTTLDVQDGNYSGIVQKIEYQVKIGEKWNREGTETVTEEEMLQHAPDKTRFRITIYLPEAKTNVWLELYMKAPGFIKSFLKAAGVPYDDSGFDIEEALNKEIGVTLVTEQQPGYEPRQNVKVFKL